MLYNDTSLEPRDARKCAEAVRSHARTFFFASRLLGAEKRRATYAVYAFCRLADDLVDHAPRHLRKETLRALDDERAALAATFAGSPRDAIHRELARAIEQFSLPAEPFNTLLDALGADIDPPHFTELTDLLRYTEGVASTVGEISAHIFGLPADHEARANAIHRARLMGVAMQLTNIIRDVGEDARRGWCYVPDSDLETCAIDRREILTGSLEPGDERWRELARIEIERARRYYDLAMKGIELLDADARPCATLCATGYRAILDTVERARYDSLTRRHSVGLGRKLVLAYQARRRRPGAAADAPAHEAIA